MKPYDSLPVSVPGPFSVRVLPTRPDPNYPKPVPSWGRLLHKLIPVPMSPGLGPVSAPSPSPAPARLSWTGHRPRAGSVLGISRLCICTESVSGLGVAFVLCPLPLSAHSRPWPPPSCAHSTPEVFYIDPVRVVCDKAEGNSSIRKSSTIVIGSREKWEWENENK